jgi:hypothetical protein
MLSSHRKTASRPRHFSQPIELARFDVVGRAAADGARLKEDLTNIDSWSLGLHKDSKDPESLSGISPPIPAPLEGRATTIRGHVRLA